MKDLDLEIDIRKLIDESPYNNNTFVKVYKGPQYFITITLKDVVPFVLESIYNNDAFNKLLIEFLSDDIDFEELKINRAIGNFKQLLEISCVAIGEYFFWISEKY